MIRRRLASFPALAALVLTSCTTAGPRATAVTTSPSPSSSASPSPSTAAPRPRLPFDGKLLIADRGNNRLLLVDVNKHVLWKFPSARAQVPAGGFYFPDDAFFTDHGTGIITNEEGNDTIIRIAFPSGAVTWRYGHTGRSGSAAGFLDQPDDAYALRDGTVMVADARNCRVLFIGRDHRILGQIGRTRHCVQDPPRSLGYPNGDTPLANRNILVSEIFGSVVDEITRDGKLVWSVHLPIPYPSDPQQIGPDRYIIASYARPGGIIEFTHTGRILWRYRFSSGAQMLDHPSLAEVLPTGLICVNDDYRHRVVIIDPRTKRIVWQYGHTDVSGTGAGYLRIPDGFDLLAPDGTTPTHPWTA